MTWRQSPRLYPRKRLAASMLSGCLATLVICTLVSRRRFPALPDLSATVAVKVQIADRHGTPLMRTYTNQWNLYEQVPLHAVPELLRQTFIVAEDQRFYAHSGIDWLARAHAVWQNLRHLRGIRGASTITEQVVRLSSDRRRTVWARWVEGFEALDLERHENKDAIFEFYLNQVPYGANRRGVVQAARYYFGRDLATLSRLEQLALVVLVRNPTAFDPQRNAEHLRAELAIIIQQLVTAGTLSPNLAAQVATEPLTLSRGDLALTMPHFVGFVTAKISAEGAAPAAEAGSLASPEPRPKATRNNPKRVFTTIDGTLQIKVQKLLDRQVERLRVRGIHHGAALVVDHRSGDILSWAVAGNGTKHQANGPDGELIDAVTTNRQPGSTLKPFLYALALQSGWTAATVIRDEPVGDTVGTGIYTFRNFSRTYYGPVTLRQALGNSLNTPAIRTIKYVGRERYLELLHALGFASLSKAADFYGDGLALGDGEVSLFELVRAYSALANRGSRRELRYQLETPPLPTQRIFAETDASLISNILADPYARDLEFGLSSVLNLPVQTAVKTGTSTDYRDAWAVGYNYAYTVGIWLGNLDRSPALDVTGAVGPAVVLRSIFAELSRDEETQALYQSPLLSRQDICRHGDHVFVASGQCQSVSELFVPGTEPKTSAPAPRELHLIQPTPNLRLAIDPRAPLSAQAFKFKLDGLPAGDLVEWWVNGVRLGISQKPEFVWPLERGKQRLAVATYRNGRQMHQLEPLNFIVK